MGHDNRHRLAVDLSGNWRLYTQHTTPGTEMLGTVSQGDRTGALARTEAGVYVMVNAGAVTSLDQRRVKAALGISNNAGRPKTVGGRRVSLYLDDESLARAAKLGNGNMSEGIRQALAATRG